jgi:hypothetical protein
MAKMYPERLPESVLSDPKRTAERKVYESFSTLPKAYSVFYSVGWQAKVNGVIQDGEADFVVTHADFGILVVEVKGGGIGYDANLDRWTSTDRNGDTYTIKNPVEQAMKSRHSLFNKMTTLPGWDQRFLTMGHIVVFPDIYRESQPLKPDLPNEIFFGHDELESPENSIVKAYNYYSGQNPKNGALGIDRLQIVTGLLAHSFEIKTPLGIELGYEDEKLIQLTEQQMQVLDYLQFHRKVAIKGCAGSGKTMLALEKAKRLANEGYQVLLTCYNYALAGYLTPRVPENVTVKHFHGLCNDLAKTVGYSTTARMDDEEFYRNELPEILMKTVEKIGPQFDAIIADEGQDFHENWWIALSTLLKDKDGIFYVFYDDNQNLYNVSSTFSGLIQEEPVQLMINCRNTQNIHKVVAAFHDQNSPMQSRGPLGKPPQIFMYNGTDDLKNQVQSLLHTLIHDEHVAMSDIVILTPKTQEKSIFKTGTKLGNLAITMVHPMKPGQIQATSVYKFKGLDSQVVILVEVDESIHHNPDMIFYVGCSRARTYLIVYMDDMIPIEYKNKILPTFNQ